MQKATYDHKHCLINNDLGNKAILLGLVFALNPDFSLDTMREYEFDCQHDLFLLEESPLTIDIEGLTQSFQYVHANAHTLLSQHERFFDSLSNSIFTVNTNHQLPISDTHSQEKITLIANNQMNEHELENAQYFEE